MCTTLFFFFLPYVMLYVKLGELKNMKKNRKWIVGFTLIELLAVIVILAVIALIAAPFIVNTIEKARKKAFENSVYGVMKAYKLKTIDDKYSAEKVYNFPEGNSELLYSGTKMIGGSIFLTLDSNIEVIDITDGKYCASGNEIDLVIEKGNCKIDMDTAPILMVSPPSSGKTFLNTSIVKNEIESIEFVVVSEFPSGSVDVSDKRNRGVRLWVKDENDNGMHEVYIGAINDVVYANPDSGSLFSNLENIEKIDLSNFSTKTATNMSAMFYQTGYNSANFTLDLGDKFDTRNVNSVRYMFLKIGYNTINFTLDLGNHFDTRNMVDMSTMFQEAGYSSTNFVIDLGTNFDTSNVTKMGWMFSQTGYNSTNLSINLGNKFNTKNVTDMYYMFYNTGYSSNNFTLNLGSKFKVDKVTSLFNAFRSTGNSTSNFKPTASVKTQAEKDAILSKFPNIEVTIVS